MATPSTASHSFTTSQPRPHRTAPSANSATMNQPRPAYHDPAANTCSHNQPIPAGIPSAVNSPDPKNPSTVAAVTPVIQAVSTHRANLCDCAVCFSIFATNSACCSCSFRISCSCFSCLFRSAASRSAALSDAAETSSFTCSNAALTTGLISDFRLDFNCRPKPSLTLSAALFDSCTGCFATSSVARYMLLSSSSVC